MEKPLKLKAAITGSDPEYGQHFCQIIIFLQWKTQKYALMSPEEENLCENIPEFII
jgi:hypothetical protein